MSTRRLLGSFLVLATLLPSLSIAQGGSYAAPKDVIDRIKDEGLNRSQVMQTLSYLTDVIGPRLTGSPGMKRANDWTRDTMAKWGMQNSHLESWGPFGRGWTLKRFHAVVDGPTAFPLIAYPKAWSPGTETLIPAPVVDPKAKKSKTLPAPVKPGTAYTGEVVTFNAQNDAEMEQYKGKLKGKIVLVGAMRELKAEFEAQGTRQTERDLLELANAARPERSASGWCRTKRTRRQSVSAISVRGTAPEVSTRRRCGNSHRYRVQGRRRNCFCAGSPGCSTRSPCDRRAGRKRARAQQERRCAHSTHGDTGAFQPHLPHDQCRRKGYDDR